MVIVYTSNTGFTEKYAGMLGKAEKLRVIPLRQAELERGTEVFYMGPLMAGHVSGLDQAVKRFSVRGVCGVGMSAPGPQVMQTMKKANFTSDAPLFYLPGGWAPERVSWLKRRMVNMATRFQRKALQEKADLTPEERRQLDYLLCGGDLVAFENLGEIRKWLQARK